MPYVIDRNRMKNGLLVLAGETMFYICRRVSERKQTIHHKDFDVQFVPSVHFVCCAKQPSYRSLGSREFSRNSRNEPLNKYRVRMWQFYRFNQNPAEMHFYTTPAYSMIQTRRSMALSCAVAAIVTWWELNSALASIRHSQYHCRFRLSKLSENKAFQTIVLQEQSPFLPLTWRGGLGAMITWTAMIRECKLRVG